MKNDYKIKNIDFNSNIYKLDSAYTSTHTITPPTPLQIFISKWALRDSNYAVSYPEAASQSMFTSRRTPNIPLLACHHLRR